MKAHCIMLAGLALSMPLAAMPAEKPAENQVPVTLTEVTKGAGLTIVVLQARATLVRICWNSSGPNSPYLIANGKRYRFISGEAVSFCPGRRDYSPGDLMRLRFQPLPPGTVEFSLVEGEGGENQMADPVGSTTASRTRHWNFLHVKLR